MHSKAKKSLAVGAGLGCGCLFLAALLIVSPLGFILIPARQIWNTQRNQSEYSRNRSYYDALIDRINKDLPANGDRADYLVPDSPGDLKRIDWSLISEDDHYDFINEHRTISAQRLSDGRLKVSFETYDMGHAGYWYLVYLSGDLPYRNDPLAEAVQVAPHWWALFDNSH